ncbi:hypothetical protein JXA80_12380 [bacterium]|nr:hypothetical protein [candidate division CSSED10-310 bacterium]
MQVHRLVFFMVLAVLITGIWSCGSDDDPEDPAEPGKAIAFTADTLDPPDNAVYLAGVSVSGSELIMNINGKKIENTYGAAFALMFDPAVFEYVNATEGNFYSSSGASTTFLAAGGTNSVTIGISLLGSEVQPVSGSGTLCSIAFRAVENGRSRFDFRDNRLYDGNGEIIPDVQWFGGLGIVTD